VKLKDLLTNLPPSIAGKVEAPELGEGQSIHIRRLPLGVRASLAEVANDRSRSPLDRQRSILAEVICEQDGAKVFEGDKDDGLSLIPATLADRLVESALEMNSGGSAKKPSSPTPN
jgi:hypothetical protein